MSCLRVDNPDISGKLRRKSKAKRSITRRRFLTLVNAIQSIKESATFGARFDIRQVNRDADQRRPRSSSLRLGSHTL